MLAKLFVIRTQQVLGALNVDSKDLFREYYYKFWNFEPVFVWVSTMSSQKILVQTFIFHSHLQPLKNLSYERHQHFSWYLWSRQNDVITEPRRQHNNSICSWESKYIHFVYSIFQCLLFDKTVKYCCKNPYCSVCGGG